VRWIAVTGERNQAAVKKQGGRWRCLHAQEMLVRKKRGLGLFPAD